MASQIRQSVSGSHTDPFQLERLAEELAARELSSTSIGRPLGTEHLLLQPDLPIYVPLSHGNEFLAAETFNIEDFLLSRSYTSLPELRTELREYLSSLKEELVLLINDDYEDFISLSTDLRGEGARMGRLKAPLNGIREQIQVCMHVRHKDNHQHICRFLVKVSRAFKMPFRPNWMRGQNCETKKSISVFLVTYRILIVPFRHCFTISSRYLSLLHVLNLFCSSQNPTPWRFLHLIFLVRQRSALESMYIVHTVDYSDCSPRSRGSRGKHLSRVATEYTQLLYLVSKARAENCVYVEEIQWVRRTLAYQVFY